MSNFWNGIYGAYMTGTDGQGFALLVFFNGIIAGSDALGTRFDGSYEENAEGEISGTVRTSIPSGGNVIQGVSAGPAGLFYDVSIKLTPADLAAEFIPIPTPLGPVNLRLEKIRSLEEPQ